MDGLSPPLLRQRISKVRKGPGTTCGAEEVHMSGGSYNYLFQAEPLAMPGKLTELEAMHRRLSGLAYAADVAAATKAVIDAVRRNMAAVPSSHEWEYILGEEHDRIHHLEDDGAVDEARTRIDAIEGAQKEIGALTAPLYWVWRAVEWWDSLDGSEDDFKRVLADWRGSVPVSTAA